MDGIWAVRTNFQWVESPIIDLTALLKYMQGFMDLPEWSFVQDIDRCTVYQWGQERMFLYAVS